MADQLTALRLFVRVAQTRSFSRAARADRLSQATVSRLIAQLEERLGVTLFVRTTRALMLTDAGSNYLPRIQSALSQLDEADQVVRDTGELQGTLRVGTSSIFASRVIVPRLERFLAAHPALQVALVIDDQRQHLINERIDVAVRFGALADSSAVARSIGVWPLVAAAAPAYLARHGTPKTPMDLDRHKAIAAGPLADTAWTFRKDGDEVAVRPVSALVVSASEVAVNAAVAGLGVVAATYPSLKGHLDGGELVRVLPDWSLGTIGASVLFPSGQAPKPAARTFVQFLQVALRDFSSA